MHIFRIAMLSLPLVALSGTAFAQSVDDVKNTTNDATNKAQQGADTAKKTYDQGKKKASYGTRQGSDAMNKASDDASKAGDKASDTWDATKSKASGTANDAKKKASDAGKSTGDTAVGTTQTTAAYTPTRDTAEGRMAMPKNADVADKWSVEPLIGFGTNDFNFGVGARAGYTFKTPVYVGGTFMWYGGETNSGVSPNAVTESKSNFYYPGVEAGYDFGFKGRFLVRPYGGVGILFDRERNTVNDVSVSDTGSALMIYPGVTGRYNIPRTPAYVGGDTRLLIPLENKGASYQLFFVAGVSM